MGYGEYGSDHETGIAVANGWHYLGLKKRIPPHFFGIRNLQSLLLRVLLFDHLGKQFLQFVACLVQQFSAIAGNAIILAPAAIHNLLLAGEITGFLQMVQDGIERTRTELVAVPAQFGNHLDAANRLLAGMVKNVQPHKAAEEMAQKLITHCSFPPTCRITILTFDIERFRLILENCIVVGKMVCC